MKRAGGVVRHAAFGLALLLAGSAHAAGITGNIVNGFGQPQYPCDIDVFDRSSGAPIAVTGDSTLPNGNYAVTIPNGRYVVKFRPPIGAHVFQWTEPDVRVNNNTLTYNLNLPVGRYLSGRVVGPDGLGVPATGIRFRSAAGDAPTNVQDDGTNADGTFLTLVDPGLWNVEIIPALAQHRVPREIRDVSLAGTDQALGDVAVQAGFIVTATVTDQGFFPVLDSKLQARVSPNGGKLFTPLNTTDPTGTARAVLPAGTYDFAALPPPLQSYGTVTARSVTLTADVALPNFALPPGFALSARCVTPSLVGVANVDVDVDSLPAASPRRLETPGDATDALGNVSMMVPAWKYRVTFNPPVATRLLSVRLDSVQVNAARALGNVVLPQGHWVNVHVVAPGTGLPIAGANLDFVRVATGQLQITVNDVTNSLGTTQVVTDGDLYRLRVIPPSAQWDTLVVENFRSLADTTVTLTLQPSVTGVAPGIGAGGGLSLAAPWPNPTTGPLAVSFSADRGRVDLGAWDVSGRRVATLYRGEAFGPRTVRWDGTDDAGSRLPAGIYWLRLTTAEGAARVRRVTLSR